MWHVYRQGHHGSALVYTRILNGFQATISFDYISWNGFPLSWRLGDMDFAMRIIAHLQAWASHVGQWGLENSSEERATVLLCAGGDSRKIPGRGSTHCDVSCFVGGYLTVKTFSVWGSAFTVLTSTLHRDDFSTPICHMSWELCCSPHHVVCFSVTLHFTVNSSADPASKMKTLSDLSQVACPAGTKLGDRRLLSMSYFWYIGVLREN